MSTGQTPSSTKSLDDAIEMIGDAHLLCIIHHLSQKSMRFNELQRAINGLNPTTLSDRLKRLEKQKIVVRKEETNDKSHVVYELTKKGHATLPIINAIGKFASEYL